MFTTTTTTIPRHDITNLVLKAGEVAGLIEPRTYAASLARLDRLERECEVGMFCTFEVWRLRLEATVVSDEKWAEFTR